LSTAESRPNDSIAGPVAIVLFGASGDLTRRKLVPALHSLGCGDLLPADLHVIGVARSELSDLAFQEQLYEGVEEYARLKPSACQLWEHFAPRHTYLAGAYDDPETYQRLAVRLEELSVASASPIGALFYLAVPPALVPTIIDHLGLAGLNRNEHVWRRVIFEKPFGHNLESARSLNACVHKVFDEH